MTLASLLFHLDAKIFDQKCKLSALCSIAMSHGGAVAMALGRLKVQSSFGTNFHFCGRFLRLGLNPTVVSLGAIWPKPLCRQRPPWVSIGMSPGLTPATSRCLPGVPVYLCQRSISMHRGP